MADIEPAMVRQFLQANFSRDATSVQWIGSGWFSHAFSFTVGEQAFIFRVNSYLEDLQKDAFAYQHFASAWLPIPRVVLLGPFDQTRHFCITERCAGQTLNDMDKTTVKHGVLLLDTVDNSEGAFGWIRLPQAWPQMALCLFREPEDTLFFPRSPLIFVC